MFKKFLPLFVYVGSVIVLSGCSSGIDIIAKDTPLTNTLSHLDSPIYFGPAPQNECINPSKLEGVYAVHKSKQISRKESDTEITQTTKKTISYTNDLAEKIEKLDGEGQRIFLPYVTINHNGKAFAFLYFGINEKNQVLISKIVGCPR